MKSIIFCNNLNKIKKLFKDYQSLSYFTIQSGAEAVRISKFLEINKNAKPVNLKEFTEFRNNFTEEFISFVAELNKKNQSLFWWCLNFTSKNPISTKLYNRCFYALFIIWLINKEDIDSLLIVSNDQILLKQLKIALKNKPFKITDAINYRYLLKDIARKISPVAVIYAFFRTLTHRIYARTHCNSSLNQDKGQIVVLSLLNQQSFAPNGLYRDTYFGDFVNYLYEQGVSFLNLVAVTSPSYKKILKNACAQSLKINIIPLEYFLTFFNLTVCLWYSLYSYFSPIDLKGDTKIDSIDLTYLLKKTIRQDYISTYFYDNLRCFYAIKSLARRVVIKRFYYPFENRSFEKMCLISLRKFSPRTKIIGYQHGSISLSHTNFLLTEDEHRILPLPDTILTVGKITKDLMSRVGRFPEYLLKEGCALRQAFSVGEPKIRQGVLRNLLVALSSDHEEYVKVINFLNEAINTLNSYNIWLRPHPLVSFERALRISGKPKFKYYKSERESVKESLDWADLVLYVHSTLAIEAVSRGIPVINIEMPAPLDSDPLFSFNSLRWRVTSPSQLPEVIESIKRISDTDFSNRRISAFDYTKNYFRKVDESALRKFMSC